MSKRRHIRESWLRNIIGKKVSAQTAKLDRKYRDFPDIVRKMFQEMYTKLESGYLFDDDRYNLSQVGDIEDFESIVNESGGVFLLTPHTTLFWTRLQYQPRSITTPAFYKDKVLTQAFNPLKMHLADYEDSHLDMRTIYKVGDLYLAYAMEMLDHITLGTKVNTNKLASSFFNDVKRIIGKELD